MEIELDPADFALLVGRIGTGLIYAPPLMRGEINCLAIAEVHPFDGERCLLTLDRSDPILTRRSP